MTNVITLLRLNLTTEGVPNPLQYRLSNTSRFENLNTICVWSQHSRCLHLKENVFHIHNDI